MIRKLTDGVPTLQDTIRKLTDGIPTLQDTIRKLTDGIPTLQDTIRKLTDGIPTLRDRIVKPYDGIPTFQDRIVRPYDVVLSKNLCKLYFFLFETPRCLPAYFSTQYNQQGSWEAGGGEKEFRIQKLEYRSTPEEVEDPLGGEVKEW